MRYLQNNYVPGQPGSEVVTPIWKPCRRSTSLTRSTLLAGGEIHQIQTFTLFARPMTGDKGRRRRRSQSSSVMSSPMRRHTHLRCEAGCLRGGPRDQTDPSLQRRTLPPEQIQPKVYVTNQLKKKTFLGHNFG